MIALVCALASAAAFALGHGTADVSPLAWVAPIPILWLAFGDEPAWRVALAAAFSYAMGQLGMLWPYYRPMGPLLLVAAVGPALCFTAAALAARHAGRRLPPIAAALVFPSFWTGAEWLLATLSPHGTFGAWAYSQVSAPVVVQSASLLGLWIVGFLIAFVASSAALGVRQRVRAPFVVDCWLVIANLTFGAWTLGRTHHATIRVAASARDHDDSASPERVAIDEAAEATRLTARGATIVVFDEKAALLPDVRRDVVLEPLLTVVRRTGATLVAGFDQTGVQRRNAAYAISADGEVRTYTKRHHIPGLERDYTVGAGAGLLGRGLAVAICKDLDFQHTLRADAAAGASRGGLRVMLVPAWDFGADGWLHARMAILRGVEGGYAVVRAASNGLMTVSDAQGRVRARGASGVGSYASAIADVPLGLGPTPYVRIGDVFAWVASAAGVLLMVWSVIARGAPNDIRRVAST